jgi:tRNA nucleotidyltransferase (CCA-adding enzyme)
MHAHAPGSIEVAGLLAALPEGVRGVCRRLGEHGQRAWVVGGSLRDLLLGRPIDDWDIATDARPEQVMQLFRRVVPTGLAHGTVTVLHDGASYEVTTLRGEGAYADGRRPTDVVFLDDIVEDLARRDFTMNAMALDVAAAALVDPFGGREDLASRRLRAVGRPADRFAEDGLRVLRAARFAATLECEIEPDTLAAMATPSSLGTLRRVSAERARDEWLKAMHASRPSVAFRIMEQTRMLDVHCPELRAAVGCEQNRWHAHDVWEHTMRCLDACAPDPVLRTAALLHDVAKPRTRALSPKSNDYTFYNHELLGAEMADAILRRLKFSNEQRVRVVELIRHHLVCYSAEWTDAAVRRWIRRVGPGRIDELCALAVADGRAKGHDAAQESAAIEELLLRVADLQRQGAALSRADLALDGDRLMGELGLAPGRRVGEILGSLLELVTDDPNKNEPEALLAEARALLAKPDAAPPRRDQ